MELSPELQEVSRRVRVLRDRVLVCPLVYKHQILETVGVTMQKGLVVAVGYGRRQRRKVAFNQKQFGAGRTQYFEDGEETGKILPMRVKVGDVVEYSFRNYTKVPFDRITDTGTKVVFVGGRKLVVADGPIVRSFPGVGELLFVWQNAIMTVDPKGSDSEGMLWAQSAGYDRQGNFLSGKEEWARG